jgi:aspartate-semialdehyde dehydrogenase
MPLGNESLGVAIAGASSLRGKDLKQWLEESGFPAGEIRLVDEEFAAGTLTDVAGEPTVIQPVDESSFDHMRFVFFTGSAQFAAKHGPAAEDAGATVIDLTGGLAASSGARPWIPALDSVLLPPPVSRPANPGPGSKSQRQIRLCISPSTPAIVACMFSAALAQFSPTRVALVFFPPVSERGQAGVEELEAQTGKLLALQPMPQEVFDTQVAFNLLDQWGVASVERLSDVRSALARQVHTYLAGRAVVPAMTLVQAPVFYGYAFSAYAEFAKPQNLDALAAELARAGFVVPGDSDPAPSNITVAGEARPAIGRPAPDPNAERGYWFWGAADNLRVASANATRIAEILLAS